MVWVRGVMVVDSVAGGFLEESWIDALDRSVFVSELAADMVKRRHDRQRGGGLGFGGDVQGNANVSMMQTRQDDQACESNKN